MRRAIRGHDLGHTDSYARTHARTQIKRIRLVSNYVSIPVFNHVGLTHMADSCFPQSFNVSTKRAAPQRRLVSRTHFIMIVDNHRHTGRGFSGQLTHTNSGRYDIYSGKRQHICLTNRVTVQQNKYSSA